MYKKVVNPKTGRKVNVSSKLGKSIIQKYLTGGNTDGPFVISDNPNGFNYTKDDLLLILLNCKSDFAFWNENKSDNDIAHLNHNRLICSTADCENLIEELLPKRSIHFVGHGGWKNNHNDQIHYNDLLKYANYVLIPQLNYFYKFILVKGCLYNSGLLNNPKIQSILRIAVFFKMYSDYSADINYKSAIIADHMLGGLMDGEYNLVNPTRIFELAQNEALQYTNVQTIPVKKEIIVTPFLYKTLLDILLYYTTNTIDEDLNEFIDITLSNNIKNFIKESNKNEELCKLLGGQIDIKFITHLIDRAYNELIDTPLHLAAQQILEIFFTDNFFSIEHEIMKQDLTVKVVLLTLTGKELTVTVHPDYYIGDVKEALCTVNTEIKIKGPDFVRFIYNRKEMLNFKTLQDYNYIEGTTIHMVLQK